MMSSIPQVRYHSPDEWLEEAPLEGGKRAAPGKRSAARGLDCLRRLEP